MTLKAKILVVDDEASIRFALEEMLTRDGHQVTSVDDGEAAVALIQSEKFDLALVDLKLPGISGLEVLTELRQQLPQIVVIVLTAHASLDTAVAALRHGAHDYLFKPCKTVELRESIRKGLRNRQEKLKQQKLLRQLEQHLTTSLEDIRATITPQSEAESSATPLIPSQQYVEKPDRFLQKGELIIDFVRHVITLDNHLLELSPTEFNLLAYLISEAPRVIPPQELVREVQRYETQPWEASETVRYHIYRIRQKIKATTNRKDIIRTVRGVGYTVSK